MTEDLKRPVEIKCPCGETHKAELNVVTRMVKVPCSRGEYFIDMAR
jgi:hypothetical protein